MPKTTGVNRLAGVAIEIDAFGLGRLEAVTGSPLSRTAETVEVIFDRPNGVVTAGPICNGSSPGQPWRYQANAVIQDSWISGGLRLAVAGIEAERGWID